MQALRNLYMRIPKKYRSRVIPWFASFLFGLLITLIWGVGTLLIILVVFFVVSFLISEFGNKKAREVGQWSIGQYFRRIRGMILFALLPTVWELIKNPSLDSIIAILVIIYVALTLWKKFDEIIEDITKQIFGTRRRRR